MMKSHKLVLSVLLLAAFLGVAAQAAELKGVKFPDSLKVDGKDLILNGTGLRTATIFKVSVYAAGLYLPAKTADSAAALAAPGPKQLQMAFLRDVGANDMKDAWNKSFKENCTQSCDTGKEALEKLKALITDVKKGDRMILTMRADSVELAIGDSKKGSVTAKDFPTTLLSTWVGKNPPNEGLKEGLLGKGT